MPVGLHITISTSQLERPCTYYIAKFQFDSDPAADVYQSLRVKLGYTDQTSNQTYLGLTDADFATGGPTIAPIEPPTAMIANNRFPCFTV